MPESFIYPALTIMMEHQFIEGHEKVLAVFGVWPSFHDGEVHRLTLDRLQRSDSGAYIPVLELHLRGWVMSSSVTEDGFYKEEHDSVVQFHFEDITELRLEDFNHQNVLSCLVLTLVTDQISQSSVLHVELEHCFGLSGSFTAKRARVVGIKPFVSK